MNILFIGDIFGSPGRRVVADHLEDIVKTNSIDLVIANAENSAGGFGILAMDWVLCDCASRVAKIAPYTL